MMANGGKHIYCVIKTDDVRNFGSIGIGGQDDEVCTVPHRDIAAVVSDSPVISYSSLNKEDLIRQLAAHQSVVEQVMKDYTVLPIKFGTIARDVENVREILKKAYTDFKSALEKMDNKVELDVVALWNDLNSTFQEIGEKKEIKEFKQEIMRKPTDQTYEDRINLGKMVKSVLDEKRNRCATEILEVLKEEAEDFRSHPLMADSMIMNIAFLINRSKEKEFEQKVNELNEKYREKIDFRIVGPLPPYSFSTMEVRTVEFEAVDAARKALGLDDEATMFEIKEAYRELTHKCHPDENPDDIHAMEQFKRVSEAYKMLAYYCQHYKYSFREADVKNFVMVKVLELPESEG